MTGESAAGAGADGSGSLSRSIVETLLIVTVFAAAGAWPTPDVNEAVYLTKARHRADPEWGRGDFFLETPNAHDVFYVLCGPLAARLPLEQAAWIGRILGWLGVAVGFRHAIAPLLATSWSRTVAAALFSLALRHTTAAGEWVIGGCEGKVFAWAIVLGAIGEVVRGRYGPAWCAGAVATVVHPIVGGWALAAIALAWGVDREVSSKTDGRAAAWWLGGAMIAACGIVPVLAMNAGTDAATRAAGVEIYVVDRLSHHLLPRTFAAALVARHLLAIAVWWLLHRLLPATAARRRLAVVVMVALAISLAGWLVSLAEPLAPAAVHGLLRFYWFRLADVLVPLGLAAAMAAILEDATLCHATLPFSPALVRGVAMVLLGLDLGAESTHWPLPGRGVPPRADAKVDAAAWADICAWVRDHAPADACFLTPRGAASFTWRTGRREVVSWKNSPQDARALVEWRRRITECFSRDGRLGTLEISTASLGAERLQQVAKRYGADHAIVPVAAAEALPFPRLHANAAYAVVRVDPVTAASPPDAPP